MSKVQIKPLDSQGEIYATVDERGSIIGTGTKEVCEFLMSLANHKLRPANEAHSLPSPTHATIRSAIKI